MKKGLKLLDASNDPLGNFLDGTTDLMKKGLKHLLFTGIATSHSVRMEPLT